jgi:transposase
VPQPIGGHACCVSACTLFDQPDMHVRPAEFTGHKSMLTVETHEREAACPDCGVIATRAKDRDWVLLYDLPAGPSISAAPQA